MRRGRNRWVSEEIGARRAPEASSATRRFDRRSIGPTRSPFSPLSSSTSSHWCTPAATTQAV